MANPKVRTNPSPKSISETHSLTEQTQEDIKWVYIRNKVIWVLGCLERGGIIGAGGTNRTNTVPNYRPPEVQVHQSIAHARVGELV